MKYYLALISLLHALPSWAQENRYSRDTALLQPLEITAVRAADRTPVAKTNLSRKEIEKNNIGQDLPFILNQTPAVQVNSDAGNGIGYTGLRIRGTDASRINITLNGIPYNDAESQGTFFVNLPDFSASANDIQIQRGVGSSVNGTGSFGGSVNINSNENNPKKTLDFASNAGSYYSFRNSLQFNSGLLGKHLIVQARLSNITSDGYVDRASSRLASIYGSVAWVSDKKTFRINSFTGKEKTYQSWYGINEATLNSNRQYNSAGTEKPGDPYDNETDNYTQSHYQFFYNQQINTKIKSAVAIFLTRGKGYYEQYKADQPLADYGLADVVNGQDTISNTDLIRRLWLDNYFYGAQANLQYTHLRNDFIVGLFVSRYDGKHYGEVVRSITPGAAPDHYRWYNLTADKTDASSFVKWTRTLTNHWQIYTDLQLRMVNYRINGFRANPDVRIDEKYLFFNPKFGLTYTHNGNQFYISYGRAAKEPNRDDFETGNLQVPRAEKLNDFEAGFEKRKRKYNWAVNLYYMQYQDQLVLTGKINDVGAYTRTNIPKSYRAGIELQGGARLTRWLQISGNIAFSENKLNDYTAFIDDYDNGGQLAKRYGKSNISFSPAVIGGYSLSVIPYKETEIMFIGKYVSSQYLDNSGRDATKLDAYYTQDLRISYKPVMRNVRNLQFFIQFINLFDTQYVPNGYSFSYLSGDRETIANYYYPMATFNVMGGINIGL
jgi:iron complex outermembrane receptor protein